jgi:cytochrome b561
MTDQAQAPGRYDGVMIALHWIVALLIFGLWGVGHWMEGLPKDDFRAQVFGLHKGIGVIVLALVVLRIVWRTLHAAPDLPSGMGPVERLAAKGGHLLLYVLMIALPASGVIMSQTKGFAVKVFGLTLPTFVGKNEALHEVAEALHAGMGWLLAAILVAHVAAALRHQYMLRDGVLDRMRPART